MDGYSDMSVIHSENSKTLTDTQGKEHKRNKSVNSLVRVNFDSDK